MKNKILASVLGAALCASLSLGTGVRPARAETRDLVKTTAALVLAEEPPPTRSQVLQKQQEEAARVAAVEEKKEVDPTPYYKKWWFWAVSAAVVGGTVALGVWAIDPVDQPAKSCSPGVIACFGDGRKAAR
ncbi:MAG TPA: hypothetical protein VGG33_14635 [Polyangia bacterium]